MNSVEYGKQNHDVMILLHGGGLSWWNYRAEAEMLSDRFHVVLPVLDGHAGSDADFTGIEENAERIISAIDERYGGQVLVLGGLSLGAQIVTEILAKREDICRYALIESASAIPSRLTQMMIGPAFSSSYGLIRQKWFAEMQFRYLRIRPDLFDEYYRDTAAVTKENIISFMKASTGYEPKASLRNCRAKVRVAAGGKEQGQILRSARLLRDMIPESTLDIKSGLYHGEYSISCPGQYTEDLLKMIGH